MNAEIKIQITAEMIADRPLLESVLMARTLASDGFASTLVGAGATALPVTIAHAEAVELLGWHHRDPFDRMLVAQASVEHAVLISNDQALLPYGVQLVW